MIKILFFGALSQHLPKNEFSLEFEQALTVTEVLKKFSSDFPEIQNQIQQNLFYAVNQTQTSADHIVSDGDEIAFMPPFAGG